MKARKKPIVVDVVRWTGHNYKAIKCFCPHAKPVYDGRKIVSVYILTLEGAMTADIGDWIIRGVEGEFYPCAPEIFEKTYDLLTGDPK